jgi:DNA polymerase delta subunit 1
MVVFQALTWEARDEDEDHLISIFGKTEDGKSVCVTTTFEPYFYIKLPDIKYAREIYAHIKDTCTGYTVVESKDIWGFQNNQKFLFMRITFSNLKKRRTTDYFLKKPLNLSSGPFPLKVYESNLDPMLRMMHRTGIQSTGWLDTGSECVRSNLAHVNIDLFCNNWETLTPVKRDDVAPFVVASFDIESNSSTGKFPDADIDGDACFQIALTLCKLGSG